MVYWDEEFCQQLADTGRYVIRYDNRDVGRSTTYKPGSFQQYVLRQYDMHRVLQSHHQPYLPQYSGNSPVYK